MCLRLNGQAELSPTIRVRKTTARKAERVPQLDEADLTGTDLSQIDLSGAN
jgi:uncharacterized protein YjbI with pentapeptide repeats